MAIFIAFFLVVAQEVHTHILNHALRRFDRPGCLTDQGNRHQRAHHQTHLNLCEESEMCATIQEVKIQTVDV